MWDDDDDGNDVQPDDGNGDHDDGNDDHVDDNDDHDDDNDDHDDDNDDHDDGNDDHVDDDQTEARTGESGCQLTRLRWQRLCQIYFVIITTIIILLSMKICEGACLEVYQIKPPPHHI